MDSLPQELIDEIIGKVPKSSLLSCSLVARRWRRECQQRALHTIEFSSEDKVNRWWTDIPQDSDGITSYVRSVYFVKIHSWNEPALFGRVLKNLTSLRELIIARTEIPDELSGNIVRGEFGKGIETLFIWSPYCTLATMTSMILSLPNLKELGVDDNRTMSGAALPTPTHSITSRRKQLDLLELYGDKRGIGEILAKSRFTTSYLYMGLHVSGVVQLLMVSSETVVELHLRDSPNKAFPPPVPILSLPALATLRIDLSGNGPSLHLTKILCSIRSAPALTSVTLTYLSWHSVDTLESAGPWADVDRWLSRTAKDRGGLSLTLSGWPAGEPVWEGFLDGFRASGGEIKTESE